MSLLENPLINENRAGGASRPRQTILYIITENFTLETWLVGCILTCNYWGFTIISTDRFLNIKYKSLYLGRAVFVDLLNISLGVGWDSPLTRVRAAKHAKADTSSSIECKLLENSIIPLSQSPNVERAWFLWRTRPLQKVNLELSGWVLKQESAIIPG